MHGYKPKRTCKHLSMWLKDSRFFWVTLSYFLEAFKAIWAISNGLLGLDPDPVNVLQWTSHCLVHGLNLLVQFEAPGCCDAALYSAFP